METIKKLVTHSLYALLIALVAGLIWETIFQTWSKKGIFNAFPSRVELIDELNNARRYVRSQAKLTPSPAFIHHPYFGFVYNPNGEVFDGAWHRVNSQGFVGPDISAHSSDEFAIGSFGGSSALSWALPPGQKIFELYGPLSNSVKERSYSFGGGSHILPQTQNIFLYYADRVRIAIFVVGNNECSRAIDWGPSRWPLDFPKFSPFDNVILDYALSSPMIEMHQRKISLLEKLIFPETLGTALSFNQFRTLGKIWGLNSKIASFRSSSPEEALNLLRHYFRRVRDISGVTPEWTVDGRLSTDGQISKEYLDQVLKVLVTRPARVIRLVAKEMNIKMVFVVQPMRTEFLDDETRKTGRGASFYQRDCRERMGAALLAAGVGEDQILGLELEELDGITESEFLDAVHLNRAGVAILARLITERINSMPMKN